MKKALWLAVVPSKNALLRVSHLLRKKAQDPQSILWIARVKHREPPHHRQRHDRSFQRVCEGGREVSIRLPFDHDAAVDEVVADG